jgi:signal transduction histidine kinase
MLRMTTVVEGNGVRARVLDLEALLEGAPPLQISKLSSSLSHELRNPLSSVKMAVQTLQRNALPLLGERDQRRLSIANKEIRTMERMLWLFSEYGRDSAPHLEPVPLRSLVTEAAGLIEPELNDRGATLELDEAPGLPPVMVDLARLRPVLAQLLLNVAMGQPDAGKLPVRLVADPLGAAMVVEDLEAALPPEESSTLFTPFGSRLARGAGLSLAALQRVMQGLGGEVRASGSERPGIVFTLRFPS